MKNFFIGLALWVIVFGCSSQHQATYHPPEAAEPPGKYDGTYRTDYTDVIVVLNIASNNIKGYLQIRSLSSEYRMAIKGKIIDDKFQVDYINHPYIRTGFKMEVTSVSPRRIDFWLIDDNNKRYSLYALKK